MFVIYVTQGGGGGVGVHDLVDLIVKTVDPDPAPDHNLNRVKNSCHFRVF